MKTGSKSQGILITILAHTNLPAEFAVWGVGEHVLDGGDECVHGQHLDGRHQVHQQQLVLTPVGNRLRGQETG